LQLQSASSWRKKNSSKYNKITFGTEIRSITRILDQPINWHRQHDEWICHNCCRPKGSAARWSETQDAGALALEPPETPAERLLHLALHGVRLVARHPPPPLHLRVAKAIHAHPTHSAAPSSRDLRRGGGGRRRQRHGKLLPRVLRRGGGNDAVV